MDTSILFEQLEWAFNTLDPTETAKVRAILLEALEEAWDEGQEYGYQNGIDAAQPIG